MCPGGSSNCLIGRREYVCTLEGCKEQIVAVVDNTCFPPKDIAPHLEAWSLPKTKNQKRNEGRNPLLDLLEKHGVKLSPVEMEWAQSHWSNFERVVDHINSLHKLTCMGEGKGKSIICAVVRAALTAAVEIRNKQHTAETQSIPSVQELVPYLQDQAEDLKILGDSQKKKNIQKPSFSKPLENSW